jgi:pimeloyl-ACP methyl ester carboxylesterase
VGQARRADARRRNAATSEAWRDPRVGAGLTVEDPKARTVTRDGLRIAALDWGGEGVPLLLLHPNGLCAGLFDPLARRVRDVFRPVGVDLRGHGGSDAPPTVDGFAFAQMAGDVLAVLDGLGIEECVAVGQSLGGGVAIFVDRLRAGLVQRLLLCEAIAFSFEEFERRPPGTGHGDGGVFMSTIARKRRAVWPDREAVYRSYRSRPPFDALAAEALAAYVRWGFVDRPDGNVELACTPEVEATIFEQSAAAANAPAAWRHLRDLNGSATVAHGDSSDLPGEWFAAQAERAGAPRLTIPGGHFFLQEDTERAERLVREHLGRGRT